MHEFLQLLAGWWWLLLIFGGAILEFVGETFDVGVTALRWRAKAKRKHQLELKRLELKRLELQIARANAGEVPGDGAARLTVKPGPCVHRNVVPVISRAEELVAWLCRSCDARLPADWAVREEDL